MSQPVSRLFPKLSQKSDNAQLTLTANAIAVLFTANGLNHRPTIRAHKQLSIVLQNSFKLILRVNIDSMPLGILSKHLKDSLVSNASFLDISSSVSSPEDHVLLGADYRPNPVHPLNNTKVEPRKPLQGNQYLPYAVLDYITLDYRFSHLSSTFEDGVGSTSTQDGALFLPLRELLDQIVHRFVAQLVRQLPEAFGSWKHSLAAETILAGYAARHLDHMLSLSEDDPGFQRKVQMQLKRIDACLRSTKEELVTDLGQHILVEDAEESDVSIHDIRTLLPFAVQTTYKRNIRHKRIKPLVAPSNIPLELLDDEDPETPSSSQDTLVFTGTISDDETLQLDSPLFTTSPASSIRQGDLSDSPILSMDSLDLDSSPVMPHSLHFEQDDRTGTVNDVSDLDLDLDWDIRDVSGERDNGVGIAVDGENVDLAVDVDEWIEFDSVHSEEMPTLEQDLRVEGLPLVAEMDGVDGGALLWWGGDEELVHGKAEEADLDAFGFGDGDMALLDLD